jgi:hypothetical protein
MAQLPSSKRASEALRGPAIALPELAVRFK